MNLFESGMLATDAFRGVAILSGIGIAQATLPLWAARRMFSPAGLNPTYAPGSPHSRGRRRIIAAVLDHPGITWLLLLRLLGAMTLVVTAAIRTTSPVAAIVVFASGCLLSFRSALIEDNAASMNHVVLAAICAHTLQPQSTVVATAGLVFVSLQLCFAYVPGGLSKLRARNWRNGSHLASIFSDSMLRFPALGGWLRAHPGTSRFFSWATILLQLGFPLVLISPPEVAGLVLAGSLTFHVAIGFSMGLSNFLWSFAAGYPAVIWMNQQMQELIFNR